MATTQHGLETLELGSTAWRNILNYNIENLDKNRLFEVDLESELPTSTFVKNRFIYVKETNEIYYDDGTQLNKIVGGTTIQIVTLDSELPTFNFNAGDFYYSEESSSIHYDNGTQLNQIGGGGGIGDLTGYANKWLIVNAAETGLDFKTRDEMMKGGGYLSIQVGVNGAANGLNGISIGESALAQGTRCINIGRNSTSAWSTNSSVAVGNETSADGSFSTALGYDATSSISYAIAVGYSATGSNTNAIAIGQLASASKIEAISIGKQATSYNSYSFNTKHNYIQNSEVFIRNMSLNTSDLTTKLYVQSTEQIAIPNNQLFKIDYEIQIHDRTNLDYKTISGKYHGYSKNGVVNEKLFTKNVDYEDAAYTSADIDLVPTSGYQNALEVYVNTNSITSMVICHFKITYAQTV